jgi:mannose-6-phosphate isomerase-like protein (cupin superfamily)
MAITQQSTTGTADPVEPLALSRTVTDAYRNCSIARVNDHEIRMSVMTSGFSWHRHCNSDETFFAIDGELIVEFEDREVTLGPGQFLTVLKGVRHRTRPGGARSVNLTFEKIGTEAIYD